MRSGKCCSWAGRLEAQDQSTRAHSLQRLPCSAAVVTVVGTAAIPLLLKPGQEAADSMQGKDSKKWTK